VLSIVGFIVILIPLVVVHELGHFLFAKLFKVRADAFSIGFGPVLYSRKFGETDFRISAIPLGGYVKLLGEDPNTELSEEEKKRALHHQTRWKRFFIFFGGPLFNFVWATLVFMLMMALGEPQISTVVGRVLPDTAAAKAGFVAGDRILSIDGQPVKKFDDLMLKLADKPAQEVQVSVSRPDSTTPVTLKVMTSSEDGFSLYGEQKQVGSIDGIVPNPRLPKVGISNPESLAAKGGFHSGDVITAVNTQKVETYEQLEALYRSWKTGDTASESHPVVFAIDRDGAQKTVTLPPNYSGDLAKDFGLHSSELFVEQAIADTPAKKAGIQKGDRLISVDGHPIRSFFELRDLIQKGGEAHGKVTIALERAGKTIDLEITPQVSTERDPLLKKKHEFTIGVMPVTSMKDPVMVSERILNPFVLLYKGTSRMLDLSARNLVSIGKMVQGQVSVKSLGGPILIGKLAGDSLSRGLMDFLKMMAILSIGLGILNILPIPVLDGGHILMLGIEAIRGRPLTIRQIEMAQQVGFFAILLIMIIVMKNDISRLPIFN